jgi:hypothetical protein
MGLTRFFWSRTGAMHLHRLLRCIWMHLTPDAMLLVHFNPDCVIAEST